VERIAGFIVLAFTLVPVHAVALAGDDPGCRDDPEGKGIAILDDPRQIGTDTKEFHGTSHGIAGSSMAACGCLHAESRDRFTVPG
jgi:hypothetical protein